MKLIILLLTLLFCSVVINSQTPTIKFYTNNNDVINYNINDIQSIFISKTSNNYTMTIFNKNKINTSNITSEIDSIKFDIANNNEINLFVYQNGTDYQSHPLENIDSIIFIQIILPIINGINPSSGLVGDTITIDGNNFGLSKDTNYVSYEGAEAVNYISWSNTMIKVIIPHGAKNGKVFVTVNGKKSNEIDFVVITAPIITSISPTTFGVGDIITINGINFGDYPNNSSVSFNDKKAIIVTSWNNEQITCEVPAGTTNGKLFVTVNSQKSNLIDYSIYPLPMITSISLKTFQAGDEITINGSNFGANRNAGIVTFNTINATEISSWSDNQIVCKVPVGTASGKLSVTVNSQKSNEVTFYIVVPPVVSSLSLTFFQIGDEITIYGRNFGDYATKGFVTFNTAKAASVSLWNNTKIICKVPDYSSSGELFVTVNGIKSNEVSFVIHNIIEFALIPSGTFMMGNTGSYPGGEIPVHQVTISHNFYMSKYEIQQALYTEIMGKNPSLFKGNNMPVDQVTWHNAVEFCNRLSVRDGYNKCYTINGTNVTCDWNANGYRLPSEAEWEYACKAGTTTDYYSGSLESDLAKVAWYSVNGSNTTHIVGQKIPNSFGLYDMLGNVFEWVWDWSGNYDSGNATDPTGAVTGGLRVLRGGSWHNGATQNRSSIRGYDMPGSTSQTDGFRIVRNQ